MTLSEDIHKQLKMAEKFREKYERKVISIKDNLKATEMMLADAEDRIVKIQNKMEKERLEVRRALLHKNADENIMFEIVNVRDSKLGVHISEVLSVAQEDYNINEEDANKLLQGLINTGVLCNPKPDTFRAFCNTLED